MKYRPYTGARRIRRRVFFSAVLVTLLIMLLAFSIYMFFFPWPFDKGDNREPLNNDVTLNSQDNHGDTGGSPDEMVNNPLDGDELESPAGESVPQDADDVQNADNQNATEKDSPLHCAYLDFKKIDDQNAMDKIDYLIERELINSVVLDVKPSDGKLAFKTASETAISLGASSDAVNDLPEIIADLKSKGMHTTARVSVFRDNTAARSMKQFAVKTGSGASWLDREYIGWYNPYKQGWKDYTIPLLKELAGMGFDEIILDNLCFPYAGKLGLISYGEDESLSRFDAVNGALSDICDAIGDRAEISVLATRNAAESGADETAGQRIADISELAARIYFPAASSDTGFASFGKELIPFAQNYSVDISLADTSVRGFVMSEHLF